MADRAGDIPQPPVDMWRALTALSLATLGMLLLWAISGDARLVNGAPVWLKPAKFMLSFVVLFGTIALVADRMSPRFRDEWPMYLLGLSMAFAMIVEMAWIIRQSARGVDSHFNAATPLEAFMYYNVMAVGAVYLVIAVGAIGLLVKRDVATRMGPALHEGVWLGFATSFVLTLIVAGVMSGGTGPHVGVHPPGAPTVPLFGWSGVTGDLRPAHFLALHAMQAIPLLGLWLDKRVSLHGVRTVRIATVVWALMTAAVFAQAMAGRPLVPMTALPL